MLTYNGKTNITNNANNHNNNRALPSRMEVLCRALRLGRGIEAKPATPPPFILLCPKPNLGCRVVFIDKW